MPRRADACWACRRNFEAGATVQATVYETPSGYERRDYCPGCAPDADRAALASWRTRRAEPVQKKPYAFDRETACSIFEHLAPESDAQVRLRFALALLLWRKKLLKFERSVQHGAAETSRFIRTGDRQPFDVQRPDLDETELESLSEQLEQLLATGAVDAEATDAPLATAKGGESHG
jgi:hypothetical protein